MGRSLGHGMREFKDSITGKTLPDEDDDDEKVELAPTPATATTTAAVQTEPERVS